MEMGSIKAYFDFAENRNAGVMNGRLISDSAPTATRTRKPRTVDHGITRDAVTAFLTDKADAGRVDLMEEFGCEDDKKRQRIVDALVTRMKNEGVVVSPRRGVYALA